MEIRLLKGSSFEFCRKKFPWKFFPFAEPEFYSENNFSLRTNESQDFTERTK